MAWEEFERNGIKGISGDKPMDELALALKRIVSSYEDRYSRKPTVVELLYALETVITSNPARYVSDSKGLKLGEIIVNRKYRGQTPYLKGTFKNISSKIHNELESNFVNNLKKDNQIYYIY